MVINFNTVSLLGIISNLLAVPMSGAITIIGFIIVFISIISVKIAQFFSFIIYIPLSVLIFVSEIFSKISFSNILVKTPSLIFVIIYYLCLIIIFYKFQDSKKFVLKNKKYLSIILLFCLIIFLILNFIPQNLKLYFIDVGQGDSTLIITPLNKKILIDGGGSENFDVGENILLPYLLDRGIKHLDYIMVSHFDSDHVGGLLTVMEKLKVDKVIICNQGKESQNYETFKNIVEQKKIKVIVVKKRRRTKHRKRLKN